MPDKLITLREAAAAATMLMRSCALVSVAADAVRTTMSRSSAIPTCCANGSRRCSPNSVSTLFQRPGWLSSWYATVAVDQSAEPLHSPGLRPQLRRTCLDAAADQDARGRFVHNRVRRSRRDRLQRANTRTGGPVARSEKWQSVETNPRGVAGGRSRSFAQDACLDWRPAQSACTSARRLSFELSGLLNLDA